MGVVCAVWTTAFLVKFIASYFGGTIHNLNTTGENDFWTACYLAVITITTEILPIYLVIDKQFVKDFSGEYLLDLDG